MTTFFGHTYQLQEIGKWRFAGTLSDGNIKEWEIEKLDFDSKEEAQVAMQKFCEDNNFELKE